MAMIAALGQRLDKLRRPLRQNDLPLEDYGVAGKVRGLLL